MLCRMGGGKYEERLRAWVELRTRGYGRRLKLTKALGKEDSDPAWTSKYVTKKTDADLDTAIQIAQHFKIPLNAVFGVADLPTSDPDVAKLQEKIERVPRQYLPELHGAIDVFLRALPDASPPPDESLGGGQKRKGRKNR